jgi:uncharacterized protein YifN (PemK superfamily)
LKFSDILEKHFYNAIFDPVKDCEFDGKHLALVIKKNADKKTVIVLPLTTESNGEGKNKIKVGKIPNLPTSLKLFDSYAVYNQVRTLNASRLIALKEGDNRIQVPIGDSLFVKLVSLCADELLTELKPEELIKYYHERYTEVTAQEIINTAYIIKRLIISGIEKDDLELKILCSRIKDLWIDGLMLDDVISETDRQNGILDIVFKSLDDSISDILIVKEKTG